MAKKTESVKARIERQLFQYGLMIGIIYQLYQSLNNIVPTLLVRGALLDITITVILVFILFLSYRSKKIDVLVLVLHLIALSGFSYFWINFGGFAGTVPGFFCAYIGFIVVITNNKIQVIAVASTLLCLLLFFLFPQHVGMTNYYEQGKIGIFQQHVDFLVIGGIIVAFTLYLKGRFIFYRRKSAKRFRLLESVANRLIHQNEELNSEQDEVKAINENLETIIENSTKELDHKNKTLEEYAFINAHMLRGPLSRVIGLCLLMEKEESLDREQVAQIKSTAQEMDLIVRKINQVVS